MSKVQIENINVTENETTILKSINLDIEEDHVLALIGPDTKAKKYFLRLFNRLNDYKWGYQMKGTLLLDDKPIEKYKRENLYRKVGIVLSEATLFKGSILSNLSFGLKIRGIRDKKSINTAVERALEEVNLWEVYREDLNQSVEDLSPVDQYLISFARTLILDPELLLVEMPTSELSVKEKSTIESLIFSLGKDMTIIFIANDMQQAARLSNRVAFFYKKNIIEHADTRDFFTKPQHEITERYITGRF